MVEPQPVKLSLRNQPFDQAMDRLEGAGVLDAQARQCIDVEEAPVVDVAGSEPPVAELVVLAFEQMVQRKRRRCAIRSGAIGREPTRDGVVGSRYALQLGLETRRFLAVGASWPLITGGQRKHRLAGRSVLRSRFLDDHAQDFAITLRRDRQPVLEIPGRKTAFAGVVAQFDLAVFQCVRRRTSR